MSLQRSSTQVFPLFISVTLNQDYFDLSTDSNQDHFEEMSLVVSFLYPIHCMYFALRYEIFSMQPCHIYLKFEYENYVFKNIFSQTVFKGLDWTDLILASCYRNHFGQQKTLSIQPCPSPSNYLYYAFSFKISFGNSNLSTMLNAMSRDS